VTVRQLTLFGAEPRLLPSEEGSSGVDEAPAGSAAAPSTDGLQIELFAQPVVLARELEAALAAGRFEEAACLRVLLEAAGCPSVHTRRLSFLERLGRLQWKDPPGEALSVWAEIDGRAGRDLVSLDFGEDEPLADLLAEDFPPRWLACLGLIRWLWSAPPPDESDRASLKNLCAEVRPSEEAAHVFWRCLRVAESADTPEELLHEARRRMKGLPPELHTLYMRRANGSRGS
jgi:hypothetical protein